MSDTTKKINTGPVSLLLKQVIAKANQDKFQLFIDHIRAACDVFLNEGVPVGTWDIALRTQFLPKIHELSELIHALNQALIAAGLPNERLFVMLKSYVRSLEGAISYIAGEAQSARPGELKDALDNAAFVAKTSVASLTLDAEYAEEIAALKQRFG